MSDPSGTTSPAPATLQSRLQALGTRLSGIPSRIRVATRVGNTSGFVWNLRPSNVPKLVSTLTAGAQNPSQIYRVHAVTKPNHPAVKWHDQSITFLEFDQKVDAIVASLKARGFKRGDAIMLLMKNRPEFLLTSVACTRIGAAAVTVSWRSTAPELVYLANHSGAKGVVVESDFYPILAQALPSAPKLLKENVFIAGGEVPGCTTFDTLMKASAGSDHGAADEGSVGEDAAVVMYTSGTTGKPKGAVRKFPKDAFPAALRFIAETPMRTDDVHLVSAPMYHGTSFGFLTLAHILGSTVVLLDEFKPEPFIEHVDRFGVTSAAVVPTMLHRVLGLGEKVLSKYDYRSLRCVFTIGAPLPGPLGQELMDAFGDVLFNVYGATETGLVTIAAPADLRAAPSTIGRVVPGNEIRLLDDAGNQVKAGEVGELYVRNALLVAGYHDDAEATKSSMREGFFSVGDLARQDRDGRFFIEGRKRDMVISGGVNVYPAEVEGVLESHPAVGEAAVIGVEDMEWGERVRAFVAPREGMPIDIAELKAWCKQRLAGPKMPRDFVIIAALPRNPTGKVLKRELRTITPPAADHPATLPAGAPAVVASSKA